jgi:hypothetical protein
MVSSRSASSIAWRSTSPIFRATFLSRWSSFSVIRVWEPISIGVRIEELLETTELTFNLLASITDPPSHTTTFTRVRRGAWRRPMR